MTERDPKRDYEPTVDAFVDILAEHLDPSEVRTVVDVGARDCAETVAFARKFPHAHVYAFECNPATLPICEEAISPYPNVTLIPMAVSDVEGPISFFQADTNPGASSVYRFSQRHSARFGMDQDELRELRVDATTLGRFVEKHSLSSIDALWMDIQGAELSALIGLGERLRDVRAIFTEVEFVRIYSEQPLFWEVRSYLRRHGFLLHGFSYFSGYFGDAVFINRRALGTWARLRLRARDLGALSRSVLPLLGIGRYRDRFRQRMARAGSS